MLAQGSFKKTIFSISVYAVVALFLIYMMALQVSPSIITTQLIEEFNIDASILGMIAGGYFYSYTLMQVPSGLLYDRFSLRWVITLAALTCTIGALIFGTTHSIYMLAFSRFLMGAGSAFPFVGLLTVSARFFRPSLFALFTGVTQFLAALGAVGGAYPLAALVNTIGWRPTFLQLGIFGIAVTFLSALIVRDRPHQTCAVPQASINYKLSVKESFKITFKDKQLLWVCLYAACGYSPILIFAGLWGMPYLTTKFGLSNTEAAMGISLVWLGLAVLSPILGFLSDKIQRRNPPMIAAALLGLGSTLAILYAPTLHFGVLLLLLFLFGCATSGQLLTFPINKENNPTSVSATVVGVTNMAVVVGAAIFQPLVGLLLTHNWDQTIGIDGSPIYLIKDYQAALVIIPICFFISLILSCFFIRETYCKSKYPS